MGKAKRLRAQRNEREAADEPSFPPDDHMLRDHELKLGQARLHLNELERQVGWFLEQTDETVVHEPHPEMPGHQQIWVTADSPARDPFSLLIGDCLQNLRSALDQLAFELAATFTPALSDGVAKQSEFPIFGDKGGDGCVQFHQRHSKGPKVGKPTHVSGLAKTQGMDPAAQQIIEGLQPYKCGEAYDAHPLWRIHELNRIDKHRLLHTAVAWSGGVAISFTPENADELMASLLGAPGIIDSRSREIHGRTYVGSVPVHGNPSEEIRTAHRPILAVTFEQSVPLVAGEPVLEVLGNLYNYILSDVLPPLVGFLK